MYLLCAEHAGVLRSLFSTFLYVHGLGPEGQLDVQVDSV